jgi:hypothetical protein
MQNIPLSFHSSKIKKWLIVVVLLPLLAMVAIKGLFFQGSLSVGLVCLLGFTLMVVLVFTPNVTLTENGIVIQKLWSTKQYSFQDFKEISKAAPCYSSIHFRDGTSYSFMNGTDVTSYFLLLRIQKLSRLN